MANNKLVSETYQRLLSEDCSNWFMLVITNAELHFAMVEYGRSRLRMPSSNNADWFYKLVQMYGSIMGWNLLWETAWVPEIAPRAGGLVSAREPPQKRMRVSVGSSTHFLGTTYIHISAKEKFVLPYSFQFMKLLLKFMVVSKQNAAGRFCDPAKGHQILQTNGSKLPTPWHMHCFGPDTNQIIYPKIPCPNTKSVCVW